MVVPASGGHCHARSKGPRRKRTGHLGPFSRIGMLDYLADAEIVEFAFYIKDYADEEDWERDEPLSTAKEKLMNRAEIIRTQLRVGTTGEGFWGATEHCGVPGVFAGHDAHSCPLSGGGDHCLHQPLRASWSPQRFHSAYHAHQPSLHHLL